MTLDLSVAMLVRDPPIERLVALVDYMSEIASEFVIVDTGSDKQTLQIMAALNRAPFSLPKVLILMRPWRDDFSWARNEGLTAVTRKWTLVLDPDELPTRRMMNHVESIVRDSSVEASGYLYYTRDYHGGLVTPEYEYQWHVRLFKTGVGRFYRPVHELVLLGGLDELHTRGTPTLPKAPKEAYLIHSKSSDAVVESTRLYKSMLGESGGSS